MTDILKKLCQDLDAIERELRVDLPREIARAREHGDLRENAEYKSAKERQAYLESKRAQLQKRLAALSLVNLEKIPREQIAYGSKVILYDSTAEKEVVYKLVSAEEADVSQGRISITSPIGKSLLGRRVGDEVSIQTPSGRRECEIRELITLHDAE
jgi:transcription elongation factor GreA